MKKVIAVLLVLVCFGITSCSSFDSPSTVVKEFYRFAEAGKVNDAYKLVTQDGKEMLSKYGGGVSAISKLTDEIKRKDGIKSIKILGEEITGDTANVKFELIYGDGTTKNGNEKLIKEQGSWRITVSK